MKILIPILVMLVLGFLFGLLISFFSMKFKVEEDTRLTEINDLLPGANCGTCGSAGCKDFAQKILEGKVDQNGCKVIKGEPKDKLKEYIETKLQQETKLHGGN